MPQLECKKCGWQGDQTEFVALTDASEDVDFSYCPECDSNDFESEEDEDE